MIYSSWKQYLRPEIEFHPIELAGRGRRITDPLYRTVAEMVEDALLIITEKLWGLPYALFGHSMGAMIVYELAQRIKKEKLPYPGHIFFSGRNAPQIPGKNKKLWSQMPDEEFQEEVLLLGGTSPEFFSYPELMSVFFPLLRNDFRLAEMDPSSEPSSLDCDITVFLGKEEELTAEQCDGWKKHASQSCTICHLPGGHFFIHDQTKKIVTIINTALSTLPGS